MDLASRLREGKLVIFSVCADLQIVEIQPKGGVRSNRPPYRTDRGLNLGIPLLH